MTAILTELTAEALAAAPRDNLYAFFRRLTTLPHIAVSVTEGDAVCRWRSPVPFEYLNGLLVDGAAVSPSNAVIDETEAFFAPRTSARYMWWFAQGQAPAAWHDLLLARGFHHDDTTPGMVAKMDRVDLPPDLPDGVRVVTVEDRRAMEDLARAATAGFGMSADTVPDLLTLMDDLGYELPIRNYVGYLNGEPVGTSSLLLGAGVAGIQLVATAPAARGRGIGRAMTLAAMRDAKALGYPIAILQASKMGYSVYRKLGFETTTPMHVYLSPRLNG